MIRKNDVLVVNGVRVRALSDERRIPGGYAVDVERLDDSTDPRVRLTDGRVHPAHAAGFRWVEAACNLRPAGGA